MKILLVFAHPDPDSFCGRARQLVVEEAAACGHELRQHDLVVDGFNPVFSEYERIHHVGDLTAKLSHMPELRTHVDDLQWCDTLVFVYPTWWSSQPAILKGWIDRVFMNDVAWTLPEGKARLSPLLTNITRLIAITTHGSSKWINALQGEPGKRTLFRSIRLMMGLRTRSTWIGVYGLDAMTDARDREKKLESIRRKVRRIFS